MELVLNRLTTNYTFFMREQEHFHFFEKVVLPEMIQKMMSNFSRNLMGSMRLKVWKMTLSRMMGATAYCWVPFTGTK